MKKMAIFLVICTQLLLCACGKQNVTGAGVGDTAVPMQTESSQPAVLVAEVRTDGAIYEPCVISILGGRGSIPILFHLSEDCFPDMTVTFDVSVNGGKVECTNANREKFSGREVYVDNARYCTWTFVSDDVTEALEADGAIFLSIVIRADGNVVGYGICEIGSDSGTHFALMRCETVIFPILDEELQHVTEECVEERLAECRQIVTPFDLDEKLTEQQAYHQ